MQWLFDPKSGGFDDKAKYLGADKCCLLQVDANGEARAVVLDLNGSQFEDKNDFFLDYVGRELVAAP